MYFNARFLVFIFLIIVVLSMAPISLQAQTGDPWAPLNFLIGNWSGAGSGKPGEAIAGSTTFNFDLDKNVMIRKNRAEYAPKPGGQANVVHEDLMIIYQQPGDANLRAIYFDNEKHVINYVLSYADKQFTVVFETDAADKTPRFRMVYELDADGVLNNEFFIAMPGGEFKSYVKGALKKKDN